MEPPRIFCATAGEAGTIATLTGSAARHVARVLRLGEGAAVVLFNGDGRDWRGTITAARGDAIDVRIEREQAAAGESPAAITLLQGISRGPRMDVTIQKATELGVARIQPVVTERVVVRLDAERARSRTGHWRGVAIGACEQSGRARVPAIGAPAALPDAIAALPPDEARLLLDATGRPGLPDGLAASPGIVLLIGPEGGLTAREIEMAGEAGFDRVRLGPRTLRTETAPLAALAIIQYLAGDLGPGPAGQATGAASAAR